MNLYEILGVAKSATQAEIKKAYRALALENHPDRNGGSKEAEDRLREINEAYRILGDKDRRSKYDRGDRGAWKVRQPVDESSERIAQGLMDLFKDIVSELYT